MTETNPLVLAHRAAEQYHRHLLGVQKGLFGKRGAIARWNRRWLAVVERELRMNGLQAALRAHNDLRRVFSNDLRGWVSAAQAVGEASGLVQAEAYGLPADNATPLLGLERLKRNPDDFLAVPLARYDWAGQVLRQIGRLDEQEAVKRLEKAKPVDKIRHDLAVIIPEAAILGILAWLVGAFARRGEDLLSGSGGWGKQAIATIDSRTTDTCLHVHGQVQAWSKPFRLVGEPKFAPRMQFPPFHWHCRTAVVLYHPQFDDGLTERMRAEAARELAARPGSAHPRPSGALGR